MYSALLVFHLLGLILGVGGSLAARLTAEFGKTQEPGSMVPLLKKLALMNAIGLLLLIFTGFLMVWQGQVNVEILAFKVKLLLVGLLILLSGTLHINQGRFFRTGDASKLAMNQKIQPVAMVTALAIIVAAVVAFQ